MITSFSGVWTVNRTYSVSANYQRLTSPINIRKLIGVNAPSIVIPDYMNAGLSFKYRLFKDKLIQLEPELGLNWALIKYSFPDANLRRWNSFMAEPAVNMNIQPNAYFSVGAGLSYRFHAGVSLDGIRNNDLNGVSGMVFIRVGNLGRLAVHSKRKIKLLEKQNNQIPEIQPQIINTKPQTDIENISSEPKPKKRKKSSEYQDW